MYMQRDQNDFYWEQGKFSSSVNFNFADKYDSRKK